MDDDDDEKPLVGLRHAAAQAKIKSLVDSLPLSISGFVQGGAHARPLEPLRASHVVPLQVPTLPEAERRRRPGLLRSYVPGIHSAATGDDPRVQSSLNIEH